jgi:parvulin-like peptidyl-prolyl isomerase
MKFCFSILMTGIVVCPGMAARAEVVDRIRAIVNEAVITDQQVQRSVYRAIDMDLFRQRYRSQPDEEIKSKLNEFATDSLKKLVQDQLILHEYATAEAKIPEPIIEEEVQNEIRDQFGPDRVQLIKQLEQQGMTYEALRKQKRDGLIIYIMQKKFVPDPIISPHKIETYYTDHGNDYKVEDQVNLRMIVLKKDGPDDEKVKKRADEILANIKQGASFAEMAKTYSEGSQKAQEGLTGWEDISKVNEAFRDAIAKLKPGEHTDVVDTSTACFLLRVEDRRPTHLKPLSEVRDEIEKTLRTQEKTRLYERWIKRLEKKTLVESFN